MTGRRLVVAVLALAAAVQVVVALGLPLLGLRTFSAVDALTPIAPWRAEAPIGAEVTNPLLGDTIDVYLPARIDFAERLRDGDFATWNPDPAGGVPLAALPDFALLSPFNLPFVVLPSWYAPAVAKLAEVAVAVIGMVAFLRRRGVSRPAGTFAGMVFAVCGFQVVWTNWPQTHVAALIPALFWATDRVVVERDGRSVALLAAITAAALFGGFPAVVAYTVIALGCYALARLRGLHRGASEHGGNPETRGRAGRSALVRVVAVGVGLGLGGALAAAQLVPFALRLQTLDLAYRAQVPGAHIPAEMLLTLVAPNAYGTPMDGNYIGPMNYVETQSFIGVAAVVLALVALTRHLRDGDQRALRLVLAVGAALCLVLAYVDTPLLRALQQAPLVGDNFIGRLRPLLAFFLAGLAGLGAQALWDGAPLPAPGRTGPRAVVVRVLAVGIVWGAALVALAWGITALIGTARAAGVPFDASTRLRLPLALIALCLVAIAVATVAGRARPHVRTGALVVCVAVLAVEAVAFFGPYWPRPATDRFYPETAAHDYLDERLGQDRFGSVMFALYPGTNTAYDLRSVTGHTFHQPTWADLLRAVDQNAFRLTSTFSTLSAEPAVVASPLLDRMAVRYWAAAPSEPVYGTAEPPPETGEGVATLAAGQPASAPIPAEPIRAVTVVTLDAVAPDADDVPLQVRVLDMNGQVVAEGERRLSAGLQAGAHTIPVAGEDLGDENGSGAGDALGAHRVEVSVAGTSATLRLAADADGQVLFSRTLPVDDGLVLRSAEGAALYERLGALPRVRWASDAEVVDVPAERVARLLEGVPADTVLLDVPGPTAEGAPAEISPVADEADRIALDVRAEGAGYVVIADAKQYGWRATVDGEPATLRHADHGLVAVAVPAGESEVELTPRLPGTSVGLALSAAAVLAVAALILLPALVRRARGGSAGSGRDGGPRARRDERPDAEDGVGGGVQQA